MLRNLIEKIEQISEGKYSKSIQKYKSRRKRKSGPVEIEGEDIVKALKKSSRSILKLFPSDVDVDMSSVRYEFDSGMGYMFFKMYKEYKDPIAVTDEYEGDVVHEGEAEVGISVEVYKGKAYAGIGFEEVYPTDENADKVVGYTKAAEGEASIPLGDKPSAFNKKIFDSVKKAISKATFPDWEEYEPGPDY
jgi:hypothetical protein